MKKNNIIGAAIMAGLILISLPLGVNRSLSRIRDDVEGLYYYDHASFAIYEGISNRESAAENLITVARRYTDDNPQLIPLIDELKYNVDTSTNIFGDFTRQARLNLEIGEASQALYEALSQIELSEKDAKYPDQLIAQMKSEQDKIERSSYNAEARKFNEKLDKFPVNILRHVAGIQPLGTFD